MERKLPIGIQSFEKIRNNNNVYVDKTEYIYQLVHSGIPYFFSRPRRFGKSLLLSTMKAYWEGEKELFRGLKIETLEKDNPDAWEKYPVFYFDFNKADFQETRALEAVIGAHLSEFESEYGKTSIADPLGVRFGQLIKKAYKCTGKRCVILVDEYDKPLLEIGEDKQLVEHNKAVFKGFFSSLKSEDEYIQFIFITGVTKFSKISIFSDLNNLMDISMTADFADICGITGQELNENFMPEIESLADEQSLTIDECMKKLQNRYDGYRFHQKSDGIYNPYSILCAFADKEFGDYWFETGTPTFLVEKLKRNSFDARKFTNGSLYATKSMLKDYSDDNPDVIPLLYQTGYLTIDEYHREDDSFTLAFPNEEVKYGFLESLMPAYVGNAGAGSGKDILTLKRYVESGDLESIKKVLIALFADITYTSAEVVFEHYFQTVIYLVFTLLGEYTECEHHTYTGRIDCTVKTERYVYVFEFKRDGTAREALNQIEEMNYADSYAADPRKLYKIGVNFDSKTRQMDDWIVI